MLSIRDEAVDESGAVEPNSRPTRRRLLTWYAATASVVVAADVVSKVVASHQLTRGEPVELPGGVLYLSLTGNSGAAFGIAQDYTWALTILAVSVVAAICWYVWRWLGSTVWAAALGLIAGGAVGNLVDRFFREPGFMRGEVVDFLSLGNPPVWPIFNLADSCLVAGVLLVVVMEIMGRRADGSVPRSNPKLVEKDEPGGS